MPVSHAPQPFGRYVLLDRIAFGGMAEVFRAKDGTQTVAIKRVLPHLAADPAVLQMFRDEVALGSRLNHPNIVRVLDFGRVDESWFLAMDWVDGFDLRSILTALTEGRQAQLPVPVACYVACEIAKALAYAHSFADGTGRALGIVHRDVTPANVLLSRKGEVKLTDFGIAKAEERLHRTAVGVIKGKIAYLSREQADGNADARSDIYSLGACLWEMLAGLRMVPATLTDVQALQQLASDEPFPPPSMLRATVPPEIDRVVLRAVERQAAKRYQTAAEFQVELEPLVKRMGVAAPQIATWLSRVEPQLKQRSDALDAILRSQAGSQPELLLGDEEPETGTSPANLPPLASAGEEDGATTVSAIPATKESPPSGSDDIPLGLVAGTLLEPLAPEPEVPPDFLALTPALGLEPDSRSARRTEPPPDFLALAPVLEPSAELVAAPPSALRAPVLTTDGPSAGAFRAARAPARWWKRPAIFASLGLLPLIFSGCGVVRVMGEGMSALVHEMGHTVVSNLFAQLAVPAVVMTISFEQSRIGALTIAILLAAAAWRFRRTALRWFLIPVAFLYPILAFTSAHTVLIAIAGHGFEIGFGAYFLHRAIAGGLFHDWERPVWGAFGSWLLWRNFWFDLGLITSAIERETYASVSFTGGDNDFTTVANALRTSVQSIATMMLVATVAGLVLGAGSGLLRARQRSLLDS